MNIFLFNLTSVTTDTVPFFDEISSKLNINCSRKKCFH